MALSPWQLCFHADLKCSVSACTNKRIIGNSVSSQYCRHHVCAVCLKSGAHFKRGHGEDRICHHHGCAHHDCKEPRSKKGSAYCVKHACHVKDCDRPRHAPGRCCKRHTCRGRGCVNCVDSPSSSSSSADDDDDDDDDGDDDNHGDARKKNKSRYCHGHQVCRARACTALVFLDASNRAARFCYRHFCSSPSSPCDRQRVPGDAALACRDHSCALYPACVKPRAGGGGGGDGGLFCEDHECEDGGCRRQRYGAAAGGAATTWCADHMCMAALARREECGNRREGTATNPVYCAEHEPCKESGCVGFRAARGRNARWEVCEEHLKTKCVFPTCTLDATDGAAACQYHVCRVPGCLITLSSSSSSAAATTSTSLYCDGHRCIELGCPNRRVGTTAAAAATATATATASSGGDVVDGAYCLEHPIKTQADESKFGWSAQLVSPLVDIVSMVP
ncbi:uncharacterized protein GGS25DRAFT_519820 [Hypoxylon fragiforme]|uniref:uncharacterized protein n=1 Tax=Hypoxylon fragiforme TaxID=63214 RepID=UPI0020C73943|nr:uncharacterized protein GGS25DRAFT_519820 [Hypoxylon fragiforme]KAI2611511.1 hypothetical protein GGS25DRAFT_519820 [Hypoxylon fragiforme]